MLDVYVRAISPRLVSNEDAPLRVRDHALRATTETRRQNSAAQAIVSHGRSESGVDEFWDSSEIRGDYINSGHGWPEKRKLSTWVGTST